MGESVSQALMILQFAIAVWQVLQLTPVALLLRAMYLRFVHAQVARMFGLQSIYVSGWRRGVGGAACSSPIIHAPMAAGFNPPSDPRFSSGPPISYPQLPDTFHCTWLNRKLTFSRRICLDTAYPYAYFISFETRRGKHTFYVPHWAERIWHDLHMYFKTKECITLKNTSKLVSQVVCAEVVSYVEVLRHLIVEGQVIDWKGNPVTFITKPASHETKLLACLNLLGLYGQLHSWRLAAIAALTLLTAFLQFFESARDWLYTRANEASICCIRLPVDTLLPLKWRAIVYSLNDWIPGFQPCNDVQMRVVRGDQKALHFFSVGNVECGDQLVKSPKAPLEDFLKVENTYVIQTANRDVLQLSGGFGNDLTLTSDMNNFLNLDIAKHICHFGGGALDYCRGRRVHLKSLKQSFIYPPIYDIVIWEPTKKVVVA